MIGNAKNTRTKICYLRLNRVRQFDLVVKRRSRKWEVKKSNIKRGDRFDLTYLFKHLRKNVE